MTNPERYGDIINSLLLMTLFATLQAPFPVFVGGVKS
jgi:hypothetical protein